MKTKLLSILLIATFALSGCHKFENPGDSLGGGQTSDGYPEDIKADLSAIESVVSDDAPEIDIDTSAVPEYAEQVTGSETLEGKGSSYYLEGEIALGNDEQIKVSSGSITIYLNGCSITASGDKKIFNISKSGCTIVLVDGTENYLTSSIDDKSPISSGNDLTIIGNGSLTISSRYRGIEADEEITIYGNPTINIDSVGDCIRSKGSLLLYGGNYNVTSSEGHGIRGYNVTILGDASVTTETVEKDGIHAEMNDSVSEYTIEDGFIYINSTGDFDITTTSTGDGIQADTYVYIKDGNFNIETNGGAPSIVSERTHNSADGKAIKAGTIDYEDEDGSEHELDDIYDYLIALCGGTYNISAKDDAIHSNGKLYLLGGDIEIETGDDGIHAETDLIIEDAIVNILEGYEGIEAQKIQIDGGTISVSVLDDGINAASVTGAQSDKNYQIIINGGEVTVDAKGDGVDSNGYIEINGGTLKVNGPSSNGDAALDSEYGILVNGGDLIAVGSLGMVETPSKNSAQYVISFASSSSQPSGTNISVVDNKGNEIISLITKRSSQSIIMSSSKLEKGETYKIYGDDTLLASVKISSTINSVGTTRTGSGTGGQPPKR